LDSIPVLIVGAGPVGLATAYELQSRGIRVLVVERNPTTTRHPKMDVTNGRSMEHFRRLGIVEKVRDAGVPRENVMDVAWVTRLGEWEVARFRYPNVHDWRAKIAENNDGTQPLEPYMRMSQIVLEPVLRDLLRQSPLAEIRYGWALEKFEEDSDGVTATIRSADSKVEQVRCQLLAGCDGGNSRVREQLDIACQGKWSIVRFYMVHYRTPNRDAMQPYGVAWHYQSPVGGTLIAQDDKETWTLHNIIAPDVDPKTIDPKKLLFESLGVEFEAEILQANAWTPHLVVADGYGRGRVWLAGDSVHQYIPTGGYGMNTGIGDAVDLGWKFAAMIQGWGGPGLLQSIETERRPVALANCEAAGYNMDIRIRIAEAYSPLVHEDSEAGRKAREAWGARILELRNDENESLGLELDYRYRNSPIVWNEGDEPEWHRLRFQAGTWPGKRAPHVFLETGEPIFDLFGPWFTLLQFDDRTDCSRIVSAAAERKVPLKVVQIDDANARRIYERKLVLVRPDQHVAWRGDGAPDDCMGLIDRVRGA
jgi:2-polyprenyl-6-methoxyphenol hydroxylase-like FAD-dependent oxidoreductase